MTHTALNRSTQPVKSNGAPPFLSLCSASRYILRFYRISATPPPATPRLTHTEHILPHPRAIAHRVVKLDSLALKVQTRACPMLIIQVDREQDHVDGENVNLSRSEP
jgi:hypothetical protein